MQRGTKIAATITLAFMMTVVAQGKPPQPAGREVNVCMPLLPFTSLPRARGLASTMFADIGVTVRWHAGPEACPAPAIQIGLSDRTPESLLPGTLAYALPYEGTHIRVFYDRVSARREPELVWRLLAHVLVHEITHILQGINRHSARGIMKARWDWMDFGSMLQKPLTFDPEDIELIYRGLAARRPASGMASAASAAAVAAH